MNVITPQPSALQKESAMRNRATVLGFAVALLFTGVGTAYFLIDANQEESTDGIVEQVENNPPKRLSEQEKEEMLRKIKLALSESRDIDQHSPANELNEDAAEEMPDWLTEEGLHQVSEFRKQRGYSLKSENSDYNNYDIATLESLSDSGDFVATQILAQKYHELNRRKEAYETYAKSAIYGSTSALRSLATFHQSQYYMSSSIDETQQIEAALDVLAFFQAAVIRGDTEALVDAKAFIDVNEMQLSESDRQEVYSRGKRIYNILSEVRASMGLGEFDNSIPDSLKGYYDYFK